MSDVADPEREELPLTTPGAMLARERAGKGLSVADIAAQLRYSTKQIEALEGDDYAHLPGTTFVRGMIRGYAKILGAPAAPMLEALERRQVPPPVTVDLRAPRVPFPDGKTRTTKIYVWLCAAMIVVMAGVGYEWKFGLPNLLGESVPAAAPEVVKTEPVETPAPSTVTEPASSAPSGAVVPAPERAPAQIAGSETGETLLPQGQRTTAKLRFEFQKDAWVEVKDGGGRTLIAQINPAGTQSTVEGIPPFALTIGNATNVRLTYGDRPLDLNQYIKFDVARFNLE